jgi:hypothetical protein
MGTVIALKRPRVSEKVVEHLIRLGYLRAAKRLDGDAIGYALARLNDDLRRSETITDDPGLGWLRADGRPVNRRGDRVEGGCQ